MTQEIRRKISEKIDETDRSKYEGPSLNLFRAYCDLLDRRSVSNELVEYINNSLNNMKGVDEGSAESIAWAIFMAVRSIGG